MMRNFHHVGIAVRDMEKAIAFFRENYGAGIIWRATYEGQGFETALVGAGVLRFELLAALHPDSFVAQFIENKGEGIHHMSLEVNGFDEVIEGFKTKGFKVNDEADTEDFRAAFIHPKGNFGVLTEIIEPKGDWGTC